MDLGPHAAFIWASYAAETIVLAALVGWLFYLIRRHASASSCSKRLDRYSCFA